ncbi:LruC domain-containing protein [Moritella dasanensis]|uniref:LruC domain-containing protein n=1 Tax=Moritella dasanensis TaxID=428031 RepID=UPI0002FAE1D8|nr:LruC domain-containing protein [Moritella dasanensis]
MIKFTSLRYIFVSLLLYVVTPNLLYAAPFDLCPTEAFLSQYNNNATHYKSVDLSTGSVKTIQIDDNLGTDVVNAIAFNETDRYIYGFNKQALALVKFDRNFKATVLPFTNPPTNNFYVGDIYNNKYYFYRKNTGLFYTSLDSSDAGYLTINKIGGANQSMGIADFAFHPIDGNIYAVESSTGDLYRINPTNGTASVVANTGFTAPGSAFGAAYFDILGNLYFVRNNDGNIYRTDITDPNNISGATVYFAQASPTNSNDGARCANAPVISSNTDYGDAPDTYGTTLANNGARHLINYYNYFLGSSVDAESDARIYPSSDDSISINDEDGIIFKTSLTPGLDGQVNVVIGGEASSYLNAWFDWNRDGDFNDANEHAISGLQLLPGSHDVLFRVPDDASAGASWSRFRVGNVEDASNNGGYVYGEVEDYQINISTANTTYLHYPSQNDFVTIAYEDMWPEVGDYDFNDVLIHYRVTQVMQNDKVVRIDIAGELAAYGADYSNGFAIQLPGIARSQIDESLIKLRHNGLVLQDKTPLEQGQTNAVVIITENLKHTFLKNNCGLSFYRTEQGCGNSDLFTFDITIPLTTPLALSAMPDMPLDPFIFGSENRSRNDFYGSTMPGRAFEVHLADNPVTDLGSTSYFGLHDDTSQAPSRTYRDERNLPWAIVVGAEWSPAYEGTDISIAYPEFIDFILSGGVLNVDWFNHPNTNKTYK